MTNVTIKAQTFNGLVVTGTGETRGAAKQDASRKAAEMGTLIRRIVG